MKVKQKIASRYTCITVAVLMNLKYQLKAFRLSSQGFWSADSSCSLSAHHTVRTYIPRMPQMQ